MRKEPGTYDHDYIGDGVYVCHDGYQIWLSTQEGHQIALEPAVFDSLINYEKRLKVKVEAGHD